MSKADQAMGDIDAAIAKQVSPVQKYGTINRSAAYKDIDEDHGGINQTVQAKDGAASATSMTTHSSTAPSAKDLGIS